MPHEDYRPGTRQARPVYAVPDWAHVAARGDSDGTSPRPNNYDPELYHADGQRPSVITQYSLTGLSEGLRTLAPLYPWEDRFCNGSREHFPGTARRDAAARQASVLRPYTSAERKAMPVWSGVLRYFPDAIAAVARLSKAGNDKHNPGEPMHWARGKSTDQEDCAIRHLMTPDEIDPETGEIELVAAAWRVLAALQLREEKRLREAGIKPLSGVVED